MRSLIRKYGYLTVAVLLFCAAGAFGQNPANMALTGAGNNILGGVYVGPYTANINGVSTQVVCDDWADESSIGETWTANVNSLQPLTNPSELKWGNNQLTYDQVAWLVTQMFGSPTCKGGVSSCDAVGDISFAIWQLTDPSANPFANLSGNDLTSAEAWLSQAKGLNSLSDFSSGEFAGYNIYTPTSGGPPQEFITTPESSASVLLGADLLGLFALIFFFRRRMLRAQS